MLPIDGCEPSSLAHFLLLNGVQEPTGAGGSPRQLDAVVSDVHYLQFGCMYTRDHRNRTAPPTGLLSGEGSIYNIACRDWSMHTRGGQYTEKQSLSAGECSEFRSP